MLLSADKLPTRAEVVAVSDQLALAAVREGSNEHALRLAHLAAELRERLWRVGHVESDVREAVELYQSESKSAMALGAKEAACAATLARARLAAELARDPALLYREIFVAAKIFDGVSCEALFSPVLATVEAFRPPPEVVAELEREAMTKAASLTPRTSRPASAGGPSARVVSADEGGVVLAPNAAAGARVKVAAIEPYGSKDRARVVITTSGPTSYRVGELAGPRLFVDLEHTEPSRRGEIAVGGLVERIRQSGRGDEGERSTRIVLDLASKAYRRIFFLPEPFRVVIDVATHPPDHAVFVQGSPRAVTRVALDAGHGGPDPGAIGPTGLREKDVTLAIAHLAAPVLSRELGVLTLLTRDDDRLVALDERAARANAFHADLFVSIHCNASETGAVRGVMSFVLDPSRDEVASRIAARENATSLAAATHVGSIASGLRVAELAPRSSHFAELLQRSAMASLASAYRDASDQGVRTAGFLVLLGAEMPSVLFETSFISNPLEEKRLSTAEYRQKLADGIVNAVRAYREGR